MTKEQREAALNRLASHTHELSELTPYILEDESSRTEFFGLLSTISSEFFALSTANIGTCWCGAVLEYRFEKDGKLFICCVGATEHCVEVQTK